MAEFKISKFAYTWKGNWTNGTAYIRDDIVRYNGKSYVCVRQHTADADFYTDLYFVFPGDTAQSPAWVKMTDGYEWTGDWTPNTKYGLGDIVSYGGNIYLVVSDFTSTTVFDDNLLDLTIYSAGQSWTNDWTPATRYGIGDIAKYNGIVYRCITGHTSGTVTTGLENDQSKWSVYFSGIEFKGSWATATRYKANDLVKYGGTILRCTTGHTSSTTITSSYWSTEFPGYNFAGDWAADTQYAIGDLVRHGGYLYYSTTNNANIAPGDIDIGYANWNVVSKGVNFKGEWDSALQYKTGDVVKRGGQLFIATQDSVTDGSTLDYLDSSNWEVVIPGDNWRNYWNSSEHYAVGDIVILDGSTYRCTVEHDADTQNLPGDNGSGYNYWDLLVQAGPNTGLRSLGDLLTYDLQRTLQGDGSTLGATAVEIGNSKEILTIDENDSLYYKSFNNITRGRFVAPNGVDSVERGGSPFKPWKTIRYACEQVEKDNYSGFTNIHISTGVYEEILPIIVPARTALVGSKQTGDLRAVTVTANSPIAALANDSSYSIDVLLRMRELIPDIITGIEVLPTEGNTETQVLSDELADEATSQVVRELIDNIIDYITFYVDGTGTKPETSGSNDFTTETVRISAATLIEDNISFLAEEGVAFMQFFYPNYVFDSDLCRRDTTRYLEALVHDLQYTGNYKSLMAARYYKNAVLGSALEDMFYVRDSTGVRNMTLKGLNGELESSVSYSLFFKPTGGAYVSLDPGWGPADERTWITSRSCYVQNVTTFGYAAVGQKIDGSLHNGGNKSIVSNDFTQVISDGIGAWVLNDGRAELVSVFTYYSQVGYLAENGGKIRATNGNNSYGVFGSVAVGNDPLETPRSGSVNNRNQEASVIAAFAGEVNDEILIMEFENAGQNYTEATYSIIGSGATADVVQEDFRDKAIFYPKLVNPQDSSIAGGAGFVIAGNNAQGGDSSGMIVIATNDPNEEANYLGMRLIITSGTGTGQYGVITSYNTSTKVVTVKRETDDQPGWDHVTPGWPLATVFDSSTTYRIEPRLIVSAPPYNSSQPLLPVSTYWAGIAWGETTESFTNVLGDAGTGTTIDFPPSTAAFNVTKTGRTYTVVSGGSTGAGYAVGQTITLLGEDVGGVTPDNNITITVTSISNDSTNSITGFTYTGHAASGRFVITPSTGTSAVASSDGVTWVDATMPSSRNWKCVAGGGNKFVAIAYGAAAAASSNDGLTWTARSIASRNWNSVIYAEGKFLAVSGNLNSVGISTNGTTWTVSNSLPTAPDSTINEWVDVTYGKSRFVAIANSGNMCAVSTDGGASWTGYIMDVIADSSQRDWVGVSYGNNRFVAITSQGDAAYSFDGIEWYAATMPTPDGSTKMNWKRVRHANGVFLAVCDTGGVDVAGDPTSGPTTFAATSEDGIYWTGRTLTTELNWIDAAYGNPDVTLDDSTIRDISNNTPTWILISSDQTDKVNKVNVGSTFKGRLDIASGRIGGIKIWDPGSGYTEAPTVEIFDPNKSTDPYFDMRIGDGVLGQPSWLNRGVGYKTSTTRVTISGDGFADMIPANRYITLSDLSGYPGPGAQLRFDGNDQIYTAVVITPLLNVNGGGLSAYIQLSPNFNTDNGPTHGTFVEVRERYSQCRITGHDFLDIGSGNFDETNYPTLYSTGQFFSAPENEVAEFNGGRVFYTSTDQSGNFRAGELFAVEQATGVVTISADYFDLNGLSELRLGGVRLGGSGAVVREFSTDPLFTADSNNIIPTQRAIKSYLANRLSVGGSDIATASFIAGLVKVGPNLITNTIGGSVVIPVVANFDGAQAGINGTMLAQSMFYRSFKHR
jgi:hypothetical protein